MYIFITSFFQSKYLHVINYLYVMVISVIFIISFFQSKDLNVINYLHVMLISVIFIISFCQSVVLLIEAIRTISSLFTFFDEKISGARKHVTKNCCLCCLVLAYFCLVRWFSLVTCFCPREIFSLKKRNRLEIVRIATINNTTMDPINKNLENL